MRRLVLCNMGGILASWAILGYWMIAVPLSKNSNFIPGLNSHNISAVYNALPSILLLACIVWIAVFGVVSLFLLLFKNLGRGERMYGASAMSLFLVFLGCSFYFYKVPSVFQIF